MVPLDAIPIEAIHAARERIADCSLRMPLVRLAFDGAPAEVYLKLENLQPIGSFKLRGAGNAIGLASEEQLAQGIYTASAGNMGQGVAWIAHKLGIPCRVVVPDHAPAAKLEALDRLGAEVVKVPFDEWWQVIVSHSFPGMQGYFIHPVCNADVIAGNGTIGLEILEDLPDVDTVVVPYGGGGLSTGIASALRALAPNARVVACEVATAAPLAAALEAGAPCEVDYTASFVDGIGSRGVLEEMWPLVQSLIETSLIVTLEQVTESIRLLATRNHVVAEGAGASSVAAALSGAAGSGKVVCVVSGGNLDPSKLARILLGESLSSG